MLKFKAPKKKQLNLPGQWGSVKDVASGMAHNFNNLMGVILSRTTLLRKKIQDSQVMNDLNLIEKAAFEASLIVRRLQKPLLNKNYGKKEWVNINELLSDVVDMTEPSWQEEATQKGLSIRVSLQFAVLPKMYVWSSLLKEVFMNIILNAIDALSYEGSLGGVIAIQTQTQGKALKIMISDSGKGIPKKIQKQIFKPFFSTKGERGRGLGLSTSYEIISRHKGEIQVQSTLGAGTTFTISLPISRAISRATSKALSLSKKKSESKNVNPTLGLKLNEHGTAKRIMLVDDEIDYRQATAELLTMEGYEVEQAQDAEEALEKLKHKTFDVILSDVHMPKTSGCDLAKEVKLHHKKTKVILISGFNQELNKSKMQALNIDGWLAKPCMFEDIAEVIRKTCH